MNKKTNLIRLLYAAISLALCIILPTLTGQIPQIGQALSPMHIPALLCGFACGPVWGAIVGAIGPILRSALFGMPPMFPVAVAMVFELAAYGAAAGILYRLLPKKYPYLYVSLVSVMIIGRVVGGIAMFAILGFNPEEMTITIFFTEYFVKTWPGIILHIIIIPPIVWALKRAKLLAGDRGQAVDAIQQG